MATKKTTASKLKSTNAEAVKPEDITEDEIKTAEDNVDETEETADNGDKSGVVFTEKINDNNKVKLETVIVFTNRDHRCNIGGVWYDFQKGKSTIVPANVKTILKRAGLLAVI